MSKTVALLVGGWSAEREVSLTKGKAVEAALKEAGYTVRVIDVTKDLTQLIADLTPKPDAVFNNLYGRGGEDGTIQGLLEIMKIPYTHSGVTASATGMDKPLTKAIAEQHDVRAPKGKTVTKKEVLSGDVIPKPYVVKPSNEGSSVGVRIILEGENQKPLDEESWEFGDNVLVEQYIPGRELTCAVLDGEPQAVTEIISDARFFDYEAKYQAQSTEYILPAQIEKDVYDYVMEASRKVYNALGCAGLARCDFRYDDSQSGPDGVYFLEINTQPGLTAESIGPSQVVYNGLTFPALCAHLVENAKLHNESWPDEAQEKAPSSNDAPKEARG